MKTLRALAPTLLFAAACGDPLFFAQVKEERLCLALANRSVPAPPPGADVGAQTVTWTGDLDLGSKFPGLDKKDARKGSIHMLSMAVTGSTGTDLSGVTDANVAVTDAAGTSNTFMHYLPPGAVPGRLAMTLGEDLNLLDRLDGGVLHYAISFTGKPPPTAWTAEIESCLTLDVTIDALKAMN